jgi:hypothetical protein
MIFGDFRQAYGCVLPEKLETDLLTFGTSVGILKLINITIRYMYRYYCHKTSGKAWDGLTPLLLCLALQCVIKTG